jgi:hypothetical protein
LKNLSFILLALLLQSCCLIGACEEEPSEEEVLPDFTSTPAIHPMQRTDLTEVSGIGASFRFQDHLWLLEDSGTDPKLDLIRINGEYAKKVSFAGRNRDWEDLAVGPGPEDGKKYIYVGEIGDNNASYKDYYVYRFLEPEGERISQYETIHFRYPNGESYDAETLMVDPWTKDIYVVTKNQLNVRVYRLPYPQNTDTVNEAQFMGTIKYFLVVSGDVSPDGNEVLLKSYTTLFYWKRKAGENLYEVMKRSHDMTAPYTLEPQGEAVCWDTASKGYFTLSERGEQSFPPPLYYYWKN